jgi:hypothetical protein
LSDQLEIVKLAAEKQKELEKTRHSKDKKQKAADENSRIPIIPELDE